MALKLSAKTELALGAYAQSSRVELIRELGQRMERLLQFEPLVFEVQQLRERVDAFSEVERQKDSWKKRCQEATRAESRATQQAGASEAAKLALHKQIKEMNAELRQLRYDTDKAQRAAKIDQMTAAGQKKRLTVLEVQNKKTQMLLHQAERKRKHADQARDEAMKTLDAERALRLQDVHRNHALRKELEECREQLREALVVRNEAVENYNAGIFERQALKLKLSATEKLNQDSEHEIGKRGNEILELQMLVADLRRRVRAAMDERQWVVDRQVALEDDFGRLQSFLARLVSETSNTSEARGALLTHQGKKGQARFNADDLRRAPDSALQDTHSSMLKRRGPLVLEDEAAMSTIPSGSALASSSGSGGASGGEWSVPAPHGCGRRERFLRHGKTDAELAMLTDLSASTVSVSPVPPAAASLHGSLYVGSGLGWRKPADGPVFKGTTGSARQMLASITDKFAAAADDLPREEEEGGPGEEEGVGPEA